MPHVAARTASRDRDTGRYQSHRPEQTLLYQIVDEYYPAFAALMAEQGKELPGYVQREFEEFLQCGRLEHGFLRVRCESCHAEHLVAFSCKRRGFCPSCGARRMAESAALLVDEVLPEQPMRQWVLSFPFQLRFLFASRPEIMGWVLGIVYRVIATHLVKKAGHTHQVAKTGAVTLIASLEGERKSFNKGKRDSEFKLESKTGELRNNTAFIDAMTEDWNRFLSVVQTDKEGNRLNIIKVDGVDSADEKVIGKRLQEIAKNATTGGLYTQVGELYGFPIKVVSERILKEGLEFTDNRFVVEGNYKYTYNNGHLAMADPLAAARNFLNAMERIPSIIDQYKAKNEVLEMEIPQLQEIAGKVWKKEDELKQLKSELAALDRKIQLELAPPTPEVAEKENEGQQLKPEAEDVRNRQAQYPENAPPQIRSPADSIVANHVIIGRPGLYAKEETRSKGLKI